MVEERKITNIAEILEYITEVSKQKNILMIQLESACCISSGLISRWKKQFPNFRCFLEVMNYLGINMVFSSGDEMLQSVEVDTSNWEEVIEEIVVYIKEVLDEKDILMRELENASGISQGLITRWKKNLKLSIKKLLDVMNCLDVSILLSVNETAQQNSSKVIFKRKLIKEKIDEINQSNSTKVVLNSELLEQKIKRKLVHELESDVAKSLCADLFSNQVTMKDKKIIQEYLTHFINLQENLKFFEEK